MKFKLLLLVIFISPALLAQTPSIQWQKCLGGSNIDMGTCVAQFIDGGYIVGGYTQSNDLFVSGLHNSVSNYPDYWIIRTDNVGNIKWQKCLGGALNEYAKQIICSADNGFVIAGSSDGNGGDVSGNHGQSDVWVVKLDSIGNIKWQKSYGGSAPDGANCIRQTTDKGYIIAGSTLSSNGDVTFNHGSNDFWIIKIDSVGTLKWQKTFGGSGSDIAYSIDQTNDNGFVVAGTTGSTDGDIVNNHGSGDYFVIRMDSAGNIKWKKTYGGSDNDQGYGVQETADRGFILNGYSVSTNGDVTGNHAATFDMWVVKLDSIGSITWEKSLGGTFPDYGNVIKQTSDGGYLALAYTTSNDGDVSGNHGLSNNDGWIVKLNSNGVWSWQKCLGGSGDEYFRDFYLTNDGGVILIGNTDSNDGDVSGNNGGDDYWLVKLGNVNPVSETELATTITISPNPSYGRFYISGLNKLNELNEVELIDINGKALFMAKVPVNNGVVKLDYRLDDGIYFIRLKSYEGRYSTHKIVIQN